MIRIKNMGKSKNLYHLINLREILKSCALSPFIRIKVDPFSRLYKTKNFAPEDKVCIIYFNF